MPKLIDLSNKRFGRLVVISRVPNKNGRPRWLCRCDCGSFCEVPSSALRSGNTRSCGCLQKDIASKNSTIHGDSKTRLYKIWACIKDRCTNPRNARYADYGGRGISVCDEWHTYIPFREWALSHGYADELSIDRADNNGSYCPENCRWVTRKEQARNKRNNRLINGKPLAQWAEEYGIDRCLLRDRLGYGWPLEKALTEPVHKI